MHLGGISLECQRWLFFPFAPIFCDGKNYSPPWQISIGSICKEQECREQNKQREVGGCKAQLDACFMIWPLQLTLYSCCSSHQSLLIHRQSKKMWGYTKGDCSFAGNSFRCYPVVLCLFLPKHPSKICNRDLENVVGKRDFNTEVNVIQDVHHVKLQHDAVILLLDRRKWDETQSICLMKADPLCFGLLKEKDTWGTPLCLLNPPITS